MRIKQHLVPLAGICHQPERPAGTQLQMRDLHVVEHAAHHHRLIAPVKLERLAQLKAQGHEGLGRTAVRARAPRPDEVRDRAVATPVTLRLDLGEQRLSPIEYRESMGLIT